MNDTKPVYACTPHAERWREGVPLREFDSYDALTFCRVMAGEFECDYLLETNLYDCGCPFLYRTVDTQIIRSTSHERS